MSKWMSKYQRKRMDTCLQKKLWMSENKWETMNEERRNNGYVFTKEAMNKRKWMRDNE